MRRWRQRRWWRRAAPATDVHPARLRAARRHRHSRQRDRPADRRRQRRLDHRRRSQRHRAEGDSRALPRRREDLAGRPHRAGHPLQPRAAHHLEPQGGDVRRRRLRRQHPRGDRQCAGRPDRPAQPAGPRLCHLCQRLRAPGQCIRLAGRLVRAQRRSGGQLRRRRDQEDARRRHLPDQGALCGRVDQQGLLRRRVHRRTRGAGRHHPLALRLGRRDLAVPGVERRRRAAARPARQPRTLQARRVSEPREARAGLRRGDAGLRRPRRRGRRPHQQPAALQRGVRSGNRQRERQPAALPRWRRGRRQLPVRCADQRAEGDEHRFALQLRPGQRRDALPRLQRLGRRPRHRHQPVAAAADGHLPGARHRGAGHADAAQLAVHRHLARPVDQVLGDTRRRLRLVVVRPGEPRPVGRPRQPAEHAARHPRRPRRVRGQGRQAAAGAWRGRHPGQHPRHRGVLPAPAGPHGPVGGRHLRALLRDPRARPRGQHGLQCRVGFIDRARALGRGRHRPERPGGGRHRRRARPHPAAVRLPCVAALQRHRRCQHGRLVHLCQPRSRVADAAQHIARRRDRHRPFGHQRHLRVEGHSVCEAAGRRTALEGAGRSRRLDLAEGHAAVRQRLRVVRPPLRPGFEQQVRRDHRHHPRPAGRVRRLPT